MDGPISIDISGFHHRRNRARDGAREGDDALLEQQAVGRLRRRTAQVGRLRTAEAKLVHLSGGVGRRQVCALSFPE